MNSITEISPLTKEPLPIEVSVLFLLCKLERHDLDKNQIVSKIENDKFSWKAFFDFSIDYHVTTLVFRNLNYLEIQIPEKFKEEFRKQVQLLFVRNSKIVHKWEKIEQQLIANSIQAIPLKGIHLLDLLYDDITLRHISDVDILIKNQDLIKCLNLFEKFGFDYVESELPSYVKKSLRFHSPYNFKKGGLLIDLHLSAHNNPNFLIDTNFFWDNLEVNEMDKTVRLDLEQTTIYVLLHLASSFFSGKFKVANFIDAAELLNKLDSKASSDFLERCKNQGVLDKITPFILLCKIYFDCKTQIPLVDEASFNDVEEIFLEYLVEGKSKKLISHELYRNVSTFDYFLRLPTISEKVNAALLFGSYILVPRKYFLKARYGKEKNIVLLLLNHFASFIIAFFSFFKRRSLALKKHRL